MWQRRTGLGYWAMALGAGAVLGALWGARRGAVSLTFYGSGSGLLWPLLIFGAIGLAFSTWRQRAAGEALCFAAGVALGLAPWAWHEWYAWRGLSRGEIWLAAMLALLTGLLVAPLYITLRRYLSARTSARERPS
jgi:hypothetical protein